MTINTYRERFTRFSKLCSNILESRGEQSRRHSPMQTDSEDEGALFHFSSWPWDKFLDSDMLPASRKTRNNVQHVKKVANRKELLIVPRQKVLSAEIIYNEKRGIWGVSKTGRVKVRLMSGETLEFILAGKADGDALLQQILQNRGDFSVRAKTSYPVMTHP
jgi:hypothetical protein